jgi:polar amino acid transport system permease protein
MTVVSGAAAVDIPPPLEKGWSRTRIAGHVLVGLWALLGIGLVVYLVAAWNPDLFRRYAPSYVSGLGVTLLLVAVSTVLGAALSIPVAAARMSSSKILSAIAYGYVYFFRGTPLLAQTFLIYYGLGTFRPQLEMLGLWSFFREAWYCAVLAFTLNTAAYQAEILRGAIESVGKGQSEGAASLGLTPWQTMRMVILPQALIVALRPYGNELILMIKGSAIVAIITVYDLMGVTRLAYSRSFDFQTYIWAAVVYLAIVELLRNVVELIERRITRHLNR